MSNVLKCFFSNFIFSFLPLEIKMICIQLECSGVKQKKKWERENKLKSKHFCPELRFWAALEANNFCNCNLPY